MQRSTPRNAELMAWAAVCMEPLARIADNSTALTAVSARINLGPWNARHDLLSTILPFDVVIQVFTFLSPASLLSVASVCCHWRTVALAAPALWSSLDIQLCKPKPPDDYVDDCFDGSEPAYLLVKDPKALKLLGLFLERSRQHKFSLRCVESEYQDHSLISKQLLDALVPHWHRIRALAIPLEDLGHVVLRRAAPAMEELIIGKLEHHSYDRNRRSLPPDLLAGIPGRLHRLVLNNVDILPEAVPTLRTVRFFHAERIRSDAVARVLAQCPALEHATARIFGQNLDQPLRAGANFKTLRLDRYYWPDVASVLQPLVQLANLRQLSVGRLRTDQISAASIIFKYLGPLVALRLTSDPGQTVILSAEDVCGAAISLCFDGYNSQPAAAGRSGLLQLAIQLEEQVKLALSHFDLNQMERLHVSPRLAGLLSVDAISRLSVHTLILQADHKLALNRLIWSVVQPVTIQASLRKVVLEYSDMSTPDEDEYAATLRSIVGLGDAQLDCIVVRVAPVDKITGSTWSEWDGSLFSPPSLQHHGASKEHKPEYVFVRSSRRSLDALATKVLFEPPICVV